jgi:DNA-binding response OmpR family regulator
MTKILLVEDDADLARTVEEWLGFEHYTIESVRNGADGMERLRMCKYDAIILDWSLPDMTGLEICKRFRSHQGATPIIMLTAKSSIADRESGLDSGADDYLTKPFAMKELSARLRALLRRPHKILPGVLTAKDVELDPGKHKVSRSGKDIDLLPKEFALLEFLMKNPDQVFSGEELLRRVWHTDSDATAEAIRTCLKRLRRKLGETDDNSIIETIYGVGYRLNSH